MAGLKFTSPGFGRISYQAPGVAYETELATAGGLAAKADASTVAGKADQSALNAVYDGGMSSNVYNRTLGGICRSLYVNSSGVLGWVSSSRVYKEDIQTAPIDVQAILAMKVVTYHRIGQPDGVIEHGLIAEDLDALGLTWLVDYGDGATPQGVRYDLLALALLPAIQSLDARLSALEVSK